MFHIFTNKKPSEFGRAQNKLLTRMKVRVAFIQEGPVWMDLGASLKKLAPLVRAAAKEGARLVKLRRFKLSSRDAAPDLGLLAHFAYGASITFPFLVAPASIVPSTKREGFRDSSHPRAQVAKRKLSVMP
jgi:hypothetical protein